MLTSVTLAEQKLPRCFCRHAGSNSLCHTRGCSIGATSGCNNVILDDNVVGCSCPTGVSPSTAVFAPRQSHVFSSGEYDRYPDNFGSHAHSRYSNTFGSYGRSRYSNTFGSYGRSRYPNTFGSRGRKRFGDGYAPHDIPSIRHFNYTTCTSFGGYLIDGFGLDTRDGFRATDCCNFCCDRTDTVPFCRTYGRRK
jgi:hypothetical protein